MTEREMATDLTQQVLSILNLTLRSVLISCAWIMTLILVQRFHTDTLNLILFRAQKYTFLLKSAIITDSPILKILSTLILFWLAVQCANRTDFHGTVLNLLVLLIGALVSGDLIKS